MEVIGYTLQYDDTPWQLFEPAKATKDWCVLWLQGFTSTIEGHTEGVIRLAEATATPFAMLNYAGHGTHPIALDEATREQQFKEVLHVYDELVRLGYKKIITIGGSFGGYMAALLASKRPLEALVLRAPANYPEDEFSLAYKDTSAGRKDKSHYLYRQSIDENYTNSAVEGVRNFKGPVYIIEHEKDEVINPSIPKSYFKAATHGNYIRVPGLKHSPKLMPNPEEYFALIELWLAAIVNATKCSGSIE
jgi:esterase/lipase